MSEVQAAILTDNRLSEGARLLLLWLSSQPADEGWVPLPFDTARSLLHGFPSDDTIRRHLRMITGSGWADRKAGGRGNPDQFRILDPLSTQGYKDRPALNPSLNSLRPGLNPSLNATVGSSIEEGSRKEEVTRASAEQEPYPIDERVTTVLAKRSEQLNGCRGAINDYLQERVPTKLQHGFIRTIETWIDGHDPSVFKLPTGSRAPPDEFPGILASALNELLATDEAKMKRPVGDPGNLRTKINILLQKRGNNGRGYGGGSPEKGGGQTGPAPSSIRGRRGGPGSG